MRLQVKFFACVIPVVTIGIAGGAYLLGVHEQTLREPLMNVSARSLSPGVALSDAQSLKQVIVWVACFTGLLLAAAFLAVSMLICVPAQRMSRAMARIAESRAYDQPLELAHRDDEIGAAARAFNNVLEVVQQSLTHQAMHDPLTGLPNRALLDHRIAPCLAQALRKETRVALFAIDVRGLKVINETLGPDTGDQLLRSTAHLLATKVRASDTLVRLNANQFLLLAPDLERNTDALRIGEKIIAMLREPHLIADRELFVDGAVGISIFPQDAADAATLITHATAALQHTQRGGQHSIAFFEQRLHRASMDRLELERQLRKAHTEGELTLFYQPQVDADGHVVGMEALVRWNHPTRGCVPPSEFIPMAEESGAIVPIGKWVLNEACRQNRAWIRAGLPPVRIAVNVSALQFAQSDFVEMLQNALTAHDLPPRSLELELTETLLLHNADETVAKLRRLRDMGISVALDDFGTGYSSLAYLQKLPIDTLKIDRSFTASLAHLPAGGRECGRDWDAMGRDADTEAPSQASHPAIVQAITTLGHALELRLVAEGVETVGQRDYLMSLGCDVMQGYLFGRPMTAERATEYLSAPSPMALALTA